MGRKFVALGLVLLIAGSVVFAWSLYVRKGERQLLEDERQFLDIIKARLDKLENINTNQESLQMLANIDLWKQRLDSYNTKRESRELLRDTSIVFIITSMAILTGWLLIWLSQTLRQLLRRLFKPSSQPKKDGQKVVIIQPEMRDNQPPDKKTGKDKSKKKNIEHSRILSEAGWHDFKTGYSDGKTLSKTETASAQTLKSFTDALNTAPKSLDLLFCDEKLSESKKSFKIRSENHSVHQKAFDYRQAGVDENTVRIEKVLNAQKEKIEQQVSEFKQMAETVKQAAERSEPIGNFIKDLTHQVSAIRDYALTQQDRIKKLQDGYDWNIIKTFGLKIIRCIDNLDDRIEQLKDAAADTEDIEELRDELVFALESGGIEQYAPEIESDYSGQEKIAEAVKERQITDKSDMKGKIAAVVKVGYRHFIDEQNFKVVRAARVKLYG
jgi:molecular chaperone GrpE (heat shock protein)